MKTMRRFFKFVLGLVLVVFVASALFIVVAAITGYWPDEMEEVHPMLERGKASLEGVRQDRIGDSLETVSHDAGVACGGLGSPGTCQAGGCIMADILPDSLRIVTWNIGYGGLGDNMDFFYDGGKRVRDTKARTMENLDGILAEMKALDADIYLLQEVDECSRRTYRINELELLQKAFPDYHLYFACNYRSCFVPLPLRSPMGKVSSGIVILSRYRAEKAERWAYPSRFPFPVSLFNLKRCLLAATFRLADGGRLVVGNTHNTAYDTGKMRDQETTFLAAWVDSLQKRGVGVVIGGDWNQYPPGYQVSGAELSNPWFAVAPLRFSAFEAQGRFVHDSSAKTLRYLDFPYSEHSTLSVTDYFYVSCSLQAGDAEVCGNASFVYSDHKPVSLTLCVD